MEYIVINYLFDKGKSVSEGFTSQSKVTGLYSIGVVLIGRNYMGMHVSMMNSKYFAFWIEKLAFMKMKET